MSPENRGCIFTPEPMLRNRNMALQSHPYLDGNLQSGSARIAGAMFDERLVGISFHTIQSDRTGSHVASGGQ